MTDNTSPPRRTIRRYAHELYPHADEFETRPLETEVPYLYARAWGILPTGTSWFAMGAPDQPDTTRQLAAARTVEFVTAAFLAFLADALHQGLAGQDAWDWANERVADGAIRWNLATRSALYIEVAPIKPYPCGPEPDHHDHGETTGNIMGHGLMTRVDCPESECPDCTEEIPA